MIQHDSFGQEASTPVQVRDVIIECFYEAHGRVLQESLGGDTDTLHASVVDMVRKSFEETGGNFDAPTKETLEKSIVYLKEFSRYFREEEKINSNYSKIKLLIDSL